MTADTGASSFDLVIVGAGTAGCVLANRLSADPDRRTLLVEAGPDYHSSALPHDLASCADLSTSHDWKYTASAGRRNPAQPLPRARVVGGCSATNACLAVRGAPRDYDAWAAEAGGADWSYQAMLPFFRTLENDLDFTGDHHGAGGPLPIRRYTPQEMTPFSAALLEAARAAGATPVDDHNRPGAVGAGPAPITLLGGRRTSTAQGYLDPVRSRPNLVIRSRTAVDRVLTHRGVARGVRLVSGEVIPAGVVVLAAGAYSSCAILLRSGIGPAAELSRLGIAPAVDLPGVGRNLQDHTGLSLRWSAPVTAPMEPRYQVLVTAADPQGRPDEVALHLIGACTGTTGEGRAEAFVSVRVMRTLSRGRVRLAGRDPALPPVVEPCYFDHPEDLRLLREGLGHAYRITGAAPLRDRFDATPRPGPALLEDPALLERHVNRSSSGYHHPVGTCRMGEDPRSGAVTDWAGRVHGVADLRVCDASVMPVIPSGNTALPTIAVAERMAHLWLRGPGGLR
ncbi:GMC family oxidoreductase [Streptomyces sp. cmx-18-6]|uniref:GMC family oxidoreductase n=1 Tax=Streptomyces sp. cmx-18-6 TaxID=2790930 RepID=UPI0039812C8B